MSKEKKKKRRKRKKTLSPTLFFHSGRHGRQVGLLQRLLGREHHRQSMRMGLARCCASIASLIDHEWRRDACRTEPSDHASQLPVTGRDASYTNGRPLRFSAELPLNMSAWISVRCSLSRGRMALACQPTNNACVLEDLSSFSKRLEDNKQQFPWPWPWSWQWDKVINHNSVYYYRKFKRETPKVSNISILHYRNSWR